MTISLASGRAYDFRAEGVQTGTPYTAAGIYDVNIPHVMINQVYGGSDDGAASHSFIELYNPCDEAVDLKGWELQYRSSEDGKEQSRAVVHPFPDRHHPCKRTLSGARHRNQAGPTIRCLTAIRSGNSHCIIKGFLLCCCVRMLH